MAATASSGRSATSCSGVTDPVLRPIRNLLPNFGGIDISPWVVVILIQVIQAVILPRLYAAVTYGAWQSLVF